MLILYGAELGQHARDVPSRALRFIDRAKGQRTEGADKKRRSGRGGAVKLVSRKAEPG
jgi:hypothetical protein